MAAGTDGPGDLFAELFLFGRRFIGLRSGDDGFGFRRGILEPELEGLAEIVIGFAGGGGQADGRRGLACHLPGKSEGQQDQP